MSLPGVHTAVPDMPGEDVVARALIDASAGRWSLWFNLQRGSMREMDDLVLAPELGCFCIEVKNWLLGSIQTYSDDEILTGSGTHEHPLKQALTSQHGLMSHLDQRGVEKSDTPYFYTTAAFPRIQRAEMYEACGDKYSSHFEGMLFRDDLGDPDATRKRLMMIGENAAINPTRRRHVPRGHQVEAVVRILNDKVVLRHRPIDPSVRAMFAKIHDAKVPDLQEDTAVNPHPIAAKERRAALQRPGVSIRNGVSRVVFHGKPGTGKTTELLKVALGHSLEGRRTLVCCYNKVLASDLRARIATLPEFVDARESLLIADMGQLGLDVSEDGLGADLYQTICVDEAQDFEQEQFERLSELAAADAEWFMSDSPGQSLYGTRSAFIDDAVTTAHANSTWEQLRVNRRAGVADRLVADAALEIAPEVSAIPRWVEDHPIRTTSSQASDAQGPLDLDLAEEMAGHLPDLSFLTAGASWWERVDDYERVLRQEFDQFRGRDAIDLAVVVVRREATSDEMKKVKKALERIGVPYLDQIEYANRRLSLVAGEVRLSTVHSIRGVDADRVLLLDLEGLEGIAQNREALLNIALSRARSGTRILMRPNDAAVGSHRAFVEGLVKAYAESVNVDTSKSAD